MRVLELGCGPRKREGAIGVDMNPRSAADVICDLNRFPYPFREGAFDLLICDHILEHLDNLIGVMEEIYRIGRDGAKVVVRVPHFSSVHFYEDPTHKRPFATHSFDYFIEGTKVRGFNYSDARFKLLRVEFPPPDGAGFLKRAVFWLINRHIDFYEKRLAFVLPRHLLYFELEIVKR